jgi:hypothetical protein
MDDRVPAPDLLMAADGGITIGDLGYRGKEFQDLLIEKAEMLMLTRADVSQRESALTISATRTWYRCNAAPQNNLGLE